MRTFFLVLAILWGLAYAFIWLDNYCGWKLVIDNTFELRSITLLHSFVFCIKQNLQGRGFPKEIGGQKKNPLSRLDRGGKGGDRKEFRFRP